MNIYILAHTRARIDEFRAHQRGHQEKSGIYQQ